MNLLLILTCAQYFCYGWTAATIGLAVYVFLLGVTEDEDGF